MLKKFLAGATAVLLALGIVTLVAAPASAHAAIVTSAVSCNSGTSATITWSIQNDWSTVSSITKVTGNATPSPSPLGVTFKKNETKTFTQAVTKADVGTTFTLGVEMTWSDYASVDSGSVTIANANFSCGDDTSKKVTICHATASDSNPYTTNSVAVSSIIQGLGGHGSSGVNVDDIIPPFTYTDGGVLETYPGNLWDAAHQLIYNNGCDLPNAPPAPSFTEAVCTATGQVGSASVTIPAGIVGIQYSVKVGGGSATTVSQGQVLSYPAGTSVTVTATALSGYAAAYPGPYSWSHTFSNVATSCVQPAAPTLVQAACTTPGQHSIASYTIVPTAHVTYYVGNKVVTGTTTVTIPSTVTITAQVAHGYTAVGVTSWTLTFTDPGACLQDVAATPTFTPATCTAPGVSSAPSYTLPTVTGVVYTVTVNGAPASGVPGIHDVAPGAQVDVVVTAATGYHLTSTSDNPWTANDVGDCAVDAAVGTQPDQTPAGCIAGIPGGITQASYTLYPADHVSYQVSADGIQFSPKAPGTYPLPQGTQVFIVATADQGYTIPGTSTWTLTPNDLGDSCLSVVTPTAPTFTDAVCTGPGASKDGVYVVPEVTGITYQVFRGGSWHDIDADTYDVNTGIHGKTIKLRAIADPGYALDPSVSSTWNHRFDWVGLCLVKAVPADPTFTDAVCTTPGSSSQGGFTITAATGVRYLVSINHGKPEVLAAGDYDAQAGDTVDIVAIARHGYVLTPLFQAWHHTFADPGTCLAIVDPVQPDVTAQTCTVGEDGQGVYADGAIVIPATTGVTYTIDGVDAGTGSHDVAPGAHTVAAIALTGYQLNADYAGPWTVTSAFAPFCGDLPTHPLVAPIVTPPQAGCAASGTYTLGNDLGIADAVRWTVNGSPVAAGTYPIQAGTTVAVHAEANGPDYGFAFDQQQDWTLGYSVPASCGQLRTLALTGGSSPVAAIGGAALLLIVGLSLIAVHLRRRRDEA